MPIPLSGGAGFQSTKVMARSSGVGGNTSTASALGLPGTAMPVTSNSKRRQAPAILFALAIWWPLSQTLARKLMPSKWSWIRLPAYSAGAMNCVRYHQDDRNALSGGIGILEKFSPIG